MKWENRMNRTPFNGRRETIPEEGPSVAMLLRIAMALSMFTLLLSTGSCKKEDRHKENAETDVVSFEDIRIGYADIEGQEKELRKFQDSIEAKSAVEEPHELLSRMVEHVPLEYIQRHLQELSQSTSHKDKPNIFVLLEQINEMRSVNEPNTTGFIEKAKEDLNADKLSVALFGLRTESQQTKAAEALASIGEPNSVRLLTMRLLHAASVYSGGSESKFYRERLRQSLVKALGSCAGLDFSDYNPASDTETLAIVKRCQDWLEKEESKGN